MYAFHNDASVKQKYLSRVAAHQAADAIIQGTGWTGSKGCAVGCTLENYDHSRYPIELGIPEWLARVEDTLFEGMSIERAKLWPKQFLEAIHVGADLETVKAPFMLLVLKSALETQEQNTAFDKEANPNVVKAIEGTKVVLKKAIKLWSRNDIGSKLWESAARSAARSVESAAWSAESAARSAARSVESAAWSARSAAWSAWSAESAARSAASAARSAAWSAESAAWSARSAAWSAEQKKFTYFADELLKMLSDCKAGGPNA